MNAIFRQSIRRVAPPRSRPVFAVLAVLLLIVGATACADGGEQSADDGTTDAAADTGSTDDAGDATFDGTIKLGAVMPLTGGQSARSEATLYGVRAGIAEVNEGGGVEVGGSTYELELVVEDSQADVTSATTAATGLVDDEGIKFVFGPITSEEMRAVGAVTSEAPALMLVGTSLIAVLGGEGDPAYDYSYSYNVAGSDVFPAWARQATTIQEQASSVGFLFQDDPVGQFFDGVFTTAFEGEGLDVAGKEFFPPEASEFTAQLSNLDSAGTDIILFGFIPEVAGTILKQGSDLQAADMFLSPDPHTIATEGGGIDVRYLATTGGGIYGPGATTKERQQFGLTMQDLNDGAALPPDAFLYYSAGGYSGVHLLAQAFEDAGTFDDVDAVKAAFESAQHELSTGEVYAIDPASHHVKGQINLDSTLVEPDGTVRRMTFNPEGTEIVAEVELD